MTSIRSYRVLFAGLLFILVACGAPGRDAPTEVLPTPAEAATTVPTPVPTAVPPTPEPVPPTPVATEAPTAAPAPEQPQLSFTPATYVDERAGFAFDYPAEWTLDPGSQVGARGGYALLTSPGTTAETLADGGARISISTNLWDPKGDLDAYVAQRKIAWDASGFAIISEDSWQLVDGRDARIFIVNTPEQPVYNLFTTIGDDYLQLGMEGDMALAEEIAHTLRPLE